IRAQLSASSRLVTCAMARSPSSDVSLVRPASFQSTSTTLAPSARRALVVARPMPGAAPVTTAVFPASDSDIAQSPPQCWRLPPANPAGAIPAQTGRLALLQRAGGEAVDKVALEEDVDDDDRHARQRHAGGDHTAIHGVAAEEEHDAGGDR